MNAKLFLNKSSCISEYNRKGIVYLKKIKPASKKMMSVQSYLNGVDAKGLLGKKVNEWKIRNFLILQEAKLLLS